MATYHIAEIEKLIKTFQEEADYNRESLRNEQYAQGIEYCIREINKVLSK